MIANGGLQVLLPLLLLLFSFVSYSLPYSHTARQTERERERGKWCTRLWQCPNLHRKIETNQTTKQNQNHKTKILIGRDADERFTDRLTRLSTNRTPGELGGSRGSDSNLKRQVTARMNALTRRANEIKFYLNSGWFALRISPRD